MRIQMIDYGSFTLVVATLVFILYMMKNDRDFYKELYLDMIDISELLLDKLKELRKGEEAKKMKKKLGKSISRQQDLIEFAVKNGYAEEFIQGLQMQAKDLVSVASDYNEVMSILSKGKKSDD